MANQKEAHIEIDGINYYTLFESPPNTSNENGNEQAPLILLSHALMSNHLMWDRTVTALNQAGYATLRYDHIGHNKTPPPSGSKAKDFYHLDDLTRHAHELVTAVTGQPKVKAVIGCSIGGVLALRCAMLFPQDVEKVISIAGPGIKTPEPAKKAWSERIEVFESDVQNGTDKLCHATVARWFPGQKPEDDLIREESLGHVKTCSLQGYKTLADTIRNYDYESEVAMAGWGGIGMGWAEKVKCLVVAGVEDSAVSPEVLEGIAGKLPGAEFKRVEGAGHLPPMHRAREFEGVAVGFLGKS
jgi:3-oxoadipate enol-lactonase